LSVQPSDDLGRGVDKTPTWSGDHERVLCLSHSQSMP
jgi:hypothetical protein